MNRSNQINKPQPGKLRKKERTQITIIWFEREDITTDPKDIKTLIKEYYEQLNAHKFDILNERDQFLEICKLSRLTQEEIDDLIRHISIKETESIIYNFPKQKSPGQDGFTGELYQTFKEEYKYTMYKNNYTPQLGGLYPRNARLVQHLKIN